MRISETYREQNRKLHERPGYGISGKKWAGLVSDLYEAYNCASVLDYGCGKGTLGQAMPHLMVRGYDPCIEGLDADPDPADLVVCGDVMEHVEEECVDEVLDHIQGLTKKVVVFVVSTRPAKKILPDGRNAHITIRDSNWWLELMMRRWKISIFNVKRDAEFVCVAKPLEVMQ